MEKDPQLVAGLLKLFLEMLPEPLLTFVLYENFIATHGLYISTIPCSDSEFIVDVKDTNAKNQQLKELVQQLPSHNKSLATVLFLFFARMVEFSAENKMAPQNLAVIFAPILLRPKQENIENLEEATKAIGGKCTADY